MNNEEVRSNCDRCGDKKNRLYTRKVTGGWIRFCHNENCYADDSFLPDGGMTPRQAMEFIKQTVKGDQTTNSVKQMTLPSDLVYELPVKAILWLCSYGLSTAEIKNYRFGWSESYQRLIMPVYRDQKLVYWQGRTFKPVTKSNPKYLNVRQSGAKNVFFKRTHPKSLDLVIVEDIISAIKCGRHCTSLALLGSYIPNSILEQVQMYQKIYMWLDADKFMSAMKYAKKINSITGKVVEVISTEKDPKEVSDLDVFRRLSRM